MSIAKFQRRAQRGKVVLISRAIWKQVAADSRGPKTEFWEAEIVGGFVFHGRDYSIMEKNPA